MPGGQGLLVHRDRRGHVLQRRAGAVEDRDFRRALAAGLSPIARGEASTINMIVVVDADPEPAALVNAATTATEVKGLALRDAGIRTADGLPASGTSTDAVVIAATGRGGRARYGGPASPLGWAVARAVRGALDRGIREWQERHP